MKYLIFIIFCLFIINVTAQIKFVPLQYPTIQSAIDSANNNDTIVIYPGLYFENLQVINKSIVVGSLFLLNGDTNYIGQTIIDGDSIGSVFKVFNDSFGTFSLSGLTIQRGFTVDSGGGIYFRNTQSQINNILIQKCRSYLGAAVLLLNSKSVLTNVNISNNLGILIFCDSMLSIHNSIIKNNDAYYGSASLIRASGALIIDHSKIINNKSPNYIIQASGYNQLNVRITYIEFSNNYYSVKGLGLGGKNVTIDHCTFSKNINQCGACVGATFLYHGGGNLDILNSIFWNNDPYEVTWNLNSYYYHSSIKNTVIKSSVSGILLSEAVFHSNPLFEDSTNNNFHLQSNSPCINAGTIHSDPDPDGTRSDIGVYYFVNNEQEICADFFSDTISGNKPMIVYFSDYSTTFNSIINSWKWDFNNDGIFESTEQNPTYTYTETGAYSVTLIVSNGVLTDTIKKKYFIKVTGGIWYINPYTGSDINNDGTEIHPFKTLGFSMNHVAKCDTIVLSQGSHHTNDTITKGVTISSYYILTGDTNDILYTYLESPNTDPSVVVNASDSVKITGLSIESTNLQGNNYAGIKIDYSYYCLISKCRIRYCNSGIFINSAYYVSIKNNYFSNNHDYAIFAYTSPLIEQNYFSYPASLTTPCYGIVIASALMKSQNVETFNTIKNNTIQGYSIAIACTGGVSPLISGNKIFGNQTGIYCSSHGCPSHPTHNTSIITNNLIYNNRIGIYNNISDPPEELSEGSISLINNTITRNDTGIHVVSNDTIILPVVNTILRGNVHNIVCDETPADFEMNISYSCLPDSFPNKVHDAGNNIFINPQFIDSINNFDLQFISPCINKGTPDTANLFLSNVDLKGSPRIFQNRIDIGAYECQTLISNNPQKLFNNNIYLFPNPATVKTYINFSSNKTTIAHVLLKDITGKTLKQFETQFDNKDSYSLLLSLDGLNAGCYFINIIYDGKNEILKLIIQ